MTLSPMAPAELAGLADELTAMGLCHGSDFYVAGLPIPGFPSSEHIGIALGKFHPGNYEIWYMDMGRSQGLFVTPDFQAASDFFKDEALRIGSDRGGARPRAEAS